jgi:hypothetical protein
MFSEFKCLRCLGKMFASRTRNARSIDRKLGTMICYRQMTVFLKEAPERILAR